MLTFFFAEAFTNSLGWLLSTLGAKGGVSGATPAFALATPIVWVIGCALSSHLTRSQPILTVSPSGKKQKRMRWAIPLFLGILFVFLLLLPRLDYSLYTYRFAMLQGRVPSEMFQSMYLMFAGTAWWAFIAFYIGLSRAFFAAVTWGLPRLVLICCLFAVPYLPLLHLASIDIAELDFHTGMDFYAFAFGNFAPVAAICFAFIGGAVMWIISRPKSDEMLN